MTRFVAFALAAVALLASSAQATPTATPCATKATSISLLCAPTASPCQRPILIEDVPATVTVYEPPHPCPLAANGQVAGYCTTKTVTETTKVPCSVCKTIPVIDALTFGTTTTTVSWICPPLPTA